MFKLNRKENGELGVNMPKMDKFLYLKEVIGWQFL
jgi:hypothetical protein